MGFSDELYNAISPLVRQALEETFKIERMFISFPQPYIFEVQSLANINTTTNERKRFTIPQERINEILCELMMSVSTNGHLYRKRSLYYKDKMAMERKIQNTKDEKEKEKAVEEYDKIMEVNNHNIKSE